MVHGMHTAMLSIPGKRMCAHFTKAEEQRNNCRPSCIFHEESKVSSMEQSWSPTMPATSKAQQRAAGAALAAKRREMDVSELQGASKQMYETMSEAELEELASTAREGLPNKKN